METLEAAVPGRGAARERRWRLALDDAHHVVVIDVRGHGTYANEGYRNPDTLDAAITITETRGRTFVDERTPLTSVPLLKEGNRVATRKNEDAGGATSARRKNPPCKSLLAGTRAIGREKERTDGSSR